MPPTLTPADAGAIAARGRTLLRRGLLTHRQFALLDALLWSCRRPGSATASASYTVLCRLAHQARETVAAGLRRLVTLGVLQKFKRRIRVGWASRQLTNAYVFRHFATEFAPATVTQRIEILEILQGSKEAREALAVIAARRMAAFSAAVDPRISAR